ncbi:hypothetical protein EYV94_04920 [Puteibacter caeruleilacunae]|nr:hypothetical protein EYV94_04920 [Puteibacter caeruleilacunae]
MVSSGTQLLVLSVLQYGMFIGLSLQIFGWSEKKIIITRLAMVTYVLIALFSLYIIYFGKLDSTVQADFKLVVLSWLSFINGTMGSIALLLDYLKRKSGILRVIIGVVAIVIFVMLTQRTPAKKNSDPKAVETESIQEGKQ